MGQYIVTTPKNPEYSGKTCGVRFEKGRAFVSEYTINAALGMSTDEVVAKMQADFGYMVEEVVQPASSVVIETRYANPAPVVATEPEPTIDQAAPAETPAKLTRKRKDAGATDAPEA